MIIVAQSTGTGFAINSNGYIATNFHVIEGSDKVTIRGVNGDHFKSYDAIIIKTDKMNDLAILKIDIKLGQIPYGFKRSKEDVASSIYAYGYPLPEVQGYELKITEGIINSNSGLKDDPRWYQHTASIQPGNSGGPLFNKYGNLVGINNAGINNDFIKKNYGTETTNVNYAIKSRYLLNLMEDLELSPLTNKGINALDLNQQYKQIKQFVYFVTASSTETNDFRWYTDVNKAVSISVETGKPLFFFFTGSDWCGWCRKLVKEVFVKQEFKAWAAKNAILVELDFPRRTPISDDLKKQAELLKVKFGVKGFPTVLFVTPTIVDGKVNFNKLGYHGYAAGGPSSWISVANRILNNK